MEPAELAAAARTAARWALIKGVAAARYEEAREVVRQTMAAQGVRALTARDELGDLAEITLSTTRKLSPVVSDRAALLAWVAERRPDMLVQSVDPTFERFLLQKLLKQGYLLDESGNGQPVPGLALKTGEPTLRIVVKDERVADVLPMLEGNEDAALESGNDDRDSGPDRGPAGTAVDDAVA